MGPLQPTLAGFCSFVSNVMKVPSYWVPIDEPVVTYAFDYALNIVNEALQSITTQPGAYSIYTQAVYNLAGDTLVNWAQDNPGDPAYNDGVQFWTWLRQQYGVNNFVPGFVQSTSDEGTSVSYMIPKSFDAYTIGDLQNLKTPYGRTYLAIASKWGTLWGMD